jgi:hypothetical protein
VKLAEVEPLAAIASGELKHRLVALAQQMSGAVLRFTRTYFGQASSIHDRLWGIKAKSRIST